MTINRDRAEKLEEERAMRREQLDADIAAFNRLWRGEYKVIIRGTATLCVAEADGKDWIIVCYVGPDDCDFATLDELSDHLIAELGEDNEDGKAS